MCGERHGIRAAGTRIELGSLLQDLQVLQVVMVSAWISSLPRRAFISVTCCVGLIVAIAFLSGPLPMGSV